MDQKNLSIDLIELSARANHILHRLKVDTIGKMMEITEEDLSSVSGVGQKTCQEIMEKIAFYKEISDAASDTTEDSGKEPVSPKWTPDIAAPENHDAVCKYLDKVGVSIDVMEELSTRAYNLLCFAGYEKLSLVIFMTENDLLKISRMDQYSAYEIVLQCQKYLSEHKDEIVAGIKDYVSPPTPVIDIFQFIHLPENYEKVLAFARIYDMQLDKMGLPNKLMHCLSTAGYTMFSEVIFQTEESLLQIKKLGKTTAKQMVDIIKDYLHKHENEILTACKGDVILETPEDVIRANILDICTRSEFCGLHFSEILANLHLQEGIDEDRIKKIIGRLLADGQLEYVDYRCYRVYTKFEQFMIASEAKGYKDLKDRDYFCIKQRLDGRTLEDIGHMLDETVTRERIRQICKKAKDKIRAHYMAETGCSFFDEDYYGYFFETYSFTKAEAGDWLGISERTYHYLDMVYDRGKKDISEALDDRKLDLALKLKIKNFINRNNILVDGVWLPKNRGELEDYFIKTYCTEEVAFNQFVDLFNVFLKRNGIEDKSLFITPDVEKTRENRLNKDANHSILWKMNRRFRYYDIDGRDFEPFLEELGLESYQNVLFSVGKLMKLYPELMRRYDIRDVYELHNLLRKIVKKGSYHNFRCEKNPTIAFGDFDRDDTVWNMLYLHAPISQPDFISVLSEEFGYEYGTIAANWINCVGVCYHAGMYTVDQKQMSPAHRNALKAVLTDDFYYLDEVKEKYIALFPDADVATVNPMNLKMMGFIVLSNYVVQNHDSLEAYFKYLLMKEDSFDLTPYRKRFTGVQAWSAVLIEMKNNYDIVEYQPNEIISYNRMMENGIDLKAIHQFCDQVYDFVRDGSYFSIKMLRNSGFESPLLELDHPDWFYANLLLGDSRFSYGQMYTNIVLYKGNESITIRSFLTDIIEQEGKIGIYDLISELQDQFECNVKAPSDILQKLDLNVIFYDKILERLYADKELYYEELGLEEVSG